ncbi:hypothetical protein LAT59_04130 [Candidatus Gracilibacteria bacterium]|nr:hypothetical protein [Candidatus Gracilibacteria bacterium]
MPVSDGLQAYFDKQRKKRVISQKLERVASDIDPAFLRSFEIFRERILGIVEENPEASDVVSSEIDELDIKLHHNRRKQSLQKAAKILEVIEKQ